MIAKVCNVITTMLLIVLLALAVVLVGPNLLGWKNFVVQTGSMEPNIPVNAMVTVNTKVDPESIQTDDVITYELNGELLSTHRVKENNISDRTFVTKGDANPNEDMTPISYDRLVGKVMYHIPYFGGLVDQIQSRTGVLLVAGVLLAVILLTFLPMIFQSEDAAPEKQGKGKGRLKEVPLRPEMQSVESIMGKPKRKKSKGGEPEDEPQQKNWYY